MRDRLLPALMTIILAVAHPAFADDTVPVTGMSDAGVADSQVADASGRGETLTAAIMPGIGREARVAALPRPLSQADVTAYSQALRLQADGQFAAADAELAKVENDVLKGHVLAQRYLSASYKPKFQDLRVWMANYADLPQAEAVYSLATSHEVRGAGSLKEPVRGTLRGSGIDTSDDGANWEEYFRDTGSAKARVIKAKVRTLLRQNKPAAALDLITGSQGRVLERLDVDELKLAVAADHFAGGRDNEAAVWATQAAERSGDELPTAHWIAGLAQWRLGKPEVARRHFEEVANADQASPWMVSAAAFWAARSNLVSRRPEVVNHWLEVAATYPRTFYGLLARQALGYETLYSWDTPPFTEGDAAILVRIPSAQRALALLQLGDRPSAEEELRKLYPRATKAVRQSMLALAQASDLASLTVRMGGMAPDMPSDTAAFPVPAWNPAGGWRIDKALVYAFVRQESAFNPKARAPSGAAGLMQLMPATAIAVAGRQVKDKLSDPEVNLSVGQRYLNKLLSEAPVNGNLFMLAAAYNAGPGKLGQWVSGMKHGDDPLLFIESLPSRETRSFVERVMTNFWIYRARMGQSSPSLDAVAGGSWPLYEGMDPPPAPRPKAGKS